MIKRFISCLHWSLSSKCCLSLTLFLLLPAAALAQTGKLIYTHTVQSDLDLPEELEQWKEYMPPSVSKTYEMAFNGVQAISSIQAVETPTSKESRSSVFTIRGGGELVKVLGALETAMDQASAMSFTMGQASHWYVDYAEGTYIDRREFLDRKFLVSGTLPEVIWKLTGEEAQFLDRRVMKATAMMDSTSIEAWFAPDIPVPLGPKHYNGLPGLILMLSLNEGQELYEATELILDAGEVEVSPPEDGREITEEEYKKLVVTKMEERQQQFRNFRVVHPDGF